LAVEEKWVDWLRRCEKRKEERSGVEGEVWAKLLLGWR